MQFAETTSARDIVEIGFIANEGNAIISEYSQSFSSAYSVSNKIERMIRYNFNKIV